MALFKAITGTNFRGALVVGSLLYVVVDDIAYSVTSGGTVTAMTGTVSGTVGVFMAHNNAATPDIVIVSPGDGAQVIVGRSDARPRLGRFARMLPQLLDQPQRALRRADLRYTNGFALQWADVPAPAPAATTTSQGNT